VAYFFGHPVYKLLQIAICNCDPDDCMTNEFQGTDIWDYCDYVCVLTCANDWCTWFPFLPVSIDV